MKNYIITIYDEKHQIIFTTMGEGKSPLDCIIRFTKCAKSMNMQIPEGAKSIGAKLAPSSRQWATLDLQSEYRK